MNLKEQLLPLHGTLRIQRVNAITKEVLDEYEDENIVVRDARSAIITAISNPTFNSTITKIKIGSDIGESITGGPAISFNDSNPDTINRDIGSFIDDGFQNGDSITVSGSINNDGEYTVSTVTDTTLTLDVGDTLTAETGTVGVDITRGTLDNPSAPLDTYDETTMDILFDAPYALNKGYADSITATFNVTIKGADVLALYPGDTSKILTSAALHTGNGNVFSYKRFPQKSISALVDINISWNIHY